MSVPLKNLRITPRDGEFLDRKTGLIGEIFYDKDADTLRLYNGNSGGIPLARADLLNVSNAVFSAKAAAAGVGSGNGGGSTTVSVGASLPSGPTNGNLWLNTNNGVLYVYINDGNSSQWIQPSIALPQLNQFATKEYVDDNTRIRLAGDDSTQITVNPNNVIQFIGTNGISTTVDSQGVVTISGTLFATTSYVDNAVSSISVKEFEFSVAADDSTQRSILSGNSIKFVGAGGVTTTSDADGTITITGGATTGNITFTGTTIDSGDSSSIIITPAVVMNSDLTIENDLFVSNTIFTDNINIVGSLTSTGSGTPEIISDNEIFLTPGTTTVLNGLTTFNQTTEVINTKTGATGVVVHDFSTGSLFLHSNVVANFTANITNVPTTNNRSISISLILDQGATAYIPNALQIDGSAQTIRWSGGSVPSGTNNYIDIVNFTLIRANNSWTVIGSLSTYN